MGQELLVSELIDAGADFVREFNDDRCVAVAFWINPTESDNLYLYIASDDIDDNNIRDAYGEVSQRLRGKRSSWLDSLQIKLISSTERIARAAIEIRDHYPARMATRYDGSSLGGTSIDSAYIYPILSATKSTP